MDLIQNVLALGANNASVVDVEQVRFERSFRSLCESNACGNYGMCWTCPPDAGDIDQLIDRARQFSSILVYQTIRPLEDSFDIEGMEQAARQHNQLARKITRMAGAQLTEPFLHLGAGGCHICPVCAKRTNDPCRYPEEALASLETYGIAVSELAKSAGMQYINGQNTVTYFGGLLFGRR